MKMCIRDSGKYARVKLDDSDKQPGWKFAQWEMKGVPAQAAWTEQVPVQRYIRYTAEELAAQEEERKKAEARKKLPDTVAALQKENEMLKQCLLEMSEIVYA